METITEENFKVLNEIEHVLTRPGMYVGSIKKSTDDFFIAGKLESVTYVQGLSKIIEEVIDNTIDECIRSKTKKMNVDVTITDTSVCVEDTGRGIPIIKHEETGVLLPELAWTKMRAGTSFDKDRIGPSQNGIGSSLTAIYSKKFIGETCDGSNYCKVTILGNMSNVDTFVKKSKSKPGTKVTFFPDFSRFETDCINDDLKKLIRERLCIVASIFPELVFTFNGENLKPKNYKDYLNTFSEHYVSYSVEGKYYFGIFNSPYDEYKQTSNINSLTIKSGTHEEQIMQGITYALRDLIKKKHKLDIAPAEIKRCLMLVFAGRSFKGMLFDSQTKGRLTNSVAETREYLEYQDIPFDKLAKKILATPELIDPILSAKLAKQAAVDAMLVTKAQKKMAGAKIKKHIPANSRNPKERQLFICEGDSALGRLKEVRDVKTMGGFPIRGKLLNTFGMKEKDIIENKECKELMAILGLKFNMTDTEVLSNLQYRGGINIFCDADVDGYHIRCLVANFLYNWPVLFKEKIVRIVNSPVVILEKGKKKEFLYTLKEYKSNLDKWKGWNVRYLKGLGGLEREEYEKVINDPNSFNPINIDDENYFGIMFDGNELVKRKEFLRGE